MNSCGRCRGEVHPEALACPHCGATFTNTSSYQWGVGIGAIAILGIFIWALFSEM